MPISGNARPHTISSLKSPLVQRSPKPGDRTGDNFRDVWHIIKE